LGTVSVRAQEPLTLQQAIHAALQHSPEAAIANADMSEAKAGVSAARALLLPRLDFTEDVSRGNDPVYAFGTRLRQGGFTQADFALNALNFPAPIGNLATRFSGSWMLFDSLRTEKEIHAAHLMHSSAASSAQTVDQQIILRVVAAYQAVLFAEREIDVAVHEQDLPTSPTCYAPKMRSGRVNPTTGTPSTAMPSLTPICFMPRGP
jgi:outer membrane protein TolC